MIQKLHNQIRSVWGSWMKEDRLNDTYQPGPYYGRRKWAKKLMRGYSGRLVLSSDEVKFAQRPPPCWPQTRRHWLANYRPSLTLFKLPASARPQHQCSSLSTSDKATSIGVLRSNFSPVETILIQFAYIQPKCFCQQMSNCTSLCDLRQGDKERRHDSKGNLSHCLYRHLVLPQTCP